MSTANEMHALIGRTAILETADEKLRVSVRVTDAKLAYGRILVLVRPVSGEAPAVWIARHRLGPLSKAREAREQAGS